MYMQKNRKKFTLSFLQNLVKVNKKEELKWRIILRILEKSEEGIIAKNIYIQGYLKMFNL